MAVFTAIGAAIASAIGLTGTFATIAGIGLSLGGTLVAGVVAAGLGVATAKVLGVNQPVGIQQQKDPGVKVQLTPSTDNRVPVFYGKIHTGGIICDAGITNRNNTMIYVQVIGEKTDTGNYTVQSIKRQDATLNFSGANVISVTDPNGTTAAKVANKMRCRVYAGNAQSSVNQIFPTTGKVAAQTLLSTITTATNYEDLVYAVFEVDYDAEEGLTGMGTITYELTNSLSEPSNVLLDYCRNDRYGAGLSNTDLDLNSFNDLYDYSTAQVAYTTNIGGAATHDRWRIDGMCSTYQAVKTNIDEISKSCSAYFTYDNKNGKFKVVPNREATTAEKNAAYTFTDDNIISSLEITSTELYNLYNSIEAEYPSVEQEDQTKIVIVNTPSGDRNTNEPDNPLQARYNLVNDAPRTHNLANIDLRQSRLSTLISFSADYSAMVVDVGDLVKVTNSVYGYTDKLFRVMKVSEVEGETGYISSKFTLLEYNDSIYEHNDIQSDGALALTGIPSWWNIWGNVDYSNIANIIAGNITIVDDPLANIANVIPDPLTGNVTGNIDIGNIDIGIGGIGIGSGGGVIPSINFPITIPDIPDISEIIANINPTGSSTGSNVANIIPPTIAPIMPPAGNTTFTPGEVINVTLPQPTMPLQDQSFSIGPLLPDIIANIDLSMINPMGRSSLIATAPNITLAPQGTIDRATLGSVQAGIQVEEDVANVNSNSSSDVQDSSTANVQIGTANSIVTPVDNIDLGGIDEGEYSAINSAVPIGLYGANSIIAYQPVRQINYKEFDIDAFGKYTANANADIVDVVGGSGIIVSVGTTPIPSVNDNFKYEVSQARGSAVAQSQTTPRPAASATKAYIPNSMDVINYANTNLQEDAANGRFRGFDVTNTDKRITKSDFYLDIGGFF